MSTDCVTPPTVRAGWDRLAGGDVEGAIEIFQASLATAPDDAAALTGMGSAFRQQGKLRDAILTCDAAISADPAYAPAWLERAFVFTAGGSVDAAFECYGRAATLDLHCADAFAGLASITARRGDAVATLRHADQALAIDPDNAIAHLALATVEIDANAAPGAETRLRRLTDTLPGPSPERSVAYNVLGDALDRQNKCAAAFDAYTHSNAYFAEIHAGPVEARAQSQTQFVDMIAHGLSALPDTSDWAVADTVEDRPAHIFLLGYPRSGTTLAENILASLADTTALEERPTLRESDQAFLTDPDGLKRLAALDQDTARPFRDAYWARVLAARAMPPTGGMFVDMDPLKATRLPIITRLFPDAKVVIMRRDPRDVVWSCFHTNFALTNSALEFTDLVRTAYHYDAMMRLTHLCLERLPVIAHVLRYDALVADFDRTTQELCAFVGQPWSETLRNFNRTATARGVTTASAAQVRKPLYDGTRQWERYAAQLAPVLPILQPWVERYGFER